MHNVDGKFVGGSAGCKRDFPASFCLCKRELFRFIFANVRASTRSGCKVEMKLEHGARNCPFERYSERADAPANLY